MTTDKVILVVWDLLIIGCWIWALKQRLLERMYEQCRNSQFNWFWLDVFHVERTRENWIRFMRRCYTGFVILSLTGPFVVLVWAH
jgi:hypothetical protein